MKSFLALTLIVTLGSTVLAAGPDQYVTLFKCKPFATVAPEAHETLSLLQGGFVGGHTIRITSLVDGETSVEQYFVKPKNKPQVGGSMVYAGKRISFSINMTTTPSKDGARLASLIVDGGEPEVWSCIRPALLKSPK